MNTNFTGDKSTMPAEAVSQDLLEEWQAAAAGIHRNPFAVFGPHSFGDCTVVTTLQSYAKQVSVVDSKGREQACKTHAMANGIFYAVFDSPVGAYRLKLTDSSGSAQLIDDPYRFSTSLTDLELHLLGEGTHQFIYESLGAHVVTHEGVEGVRFAVWAPNAHRVSVVGDFNRWNGLSHVMRLHPSIGVWEIFVPNVDVGAHYKFELLDQNQRLLPLKTDPLGQRFESPPGNASIVYADNYSWSDEAWMQKRQQEMPGLDRPVSIYEIHAGSWRRKPDEDNRPLSYRELADELLPYIKYMGFTHIEFMPLSEHPFDGSWGYQPIGMFASTFRFGTPDDFRYFVDQCHKADISVIVDWVPAHFPRDEHGLVNFDGTALYEHEDPRKGAHADWGTLIFNYGRREVVNYLIGSALYWIKEFHIDGLRVDAVASMLYLDYSREPGEWIPNEHGGNENFEAVEFLRRLNEEVHEHGAVTYAEESTAWPGVSRPTYSGGLGFTFKWNMGWMNDTLAYIGEDSLHRQHHHGKMTFGLVYAFNENFVLPLSHDEVVHGKRSLIGRMPGDAWQRFANLRTYFGAMYSHPGKKLMFMGSEFGQLNEWNHSASLDWHLVEQNNHRGVQLLVRDLNKVYRSHPALYENDFENDGFEWIDWEDSANSVLSWIRYARDRSFVISVSNFTPVIRYDYQIGVPKAGQYSEILNTDAERYGGSNVHNAGALSASEVEYQGRPAVLSLTLPPLATVYLTLNK
ncbi:MAG: 1,4-alpha-glucan branching protein GlgB [Gammaproteobacteria bacterium]